MSITPGPWKASRIVAGSFFIDSQDGGCVARVPYRENDDEVCKANARAIAALPELIKRLRLFIESCECFRAEYGRYPLFFDSDVEKSKTLLRRIGVDFSEEVKSL